MTDKVPTKVSVYFLKDWDSWHKLGEFRWDGTGEIQLECTNPNGEWILESYYNTGVPLDSEQRAVPRSEPAAFMRALMVPRNATYYRFADESDAAEPAHRPEQRPLL